MAAASLLAAGCFVFLFVLSASASTGSLSGKKSPVGHLNGVQTAFDGLAIDNATGRIYCWCVSGGIFGLSYVGLTGHGADGNLNTTGATLDGPEGLAIDPVGKKIYWASRDNNMISWADLDGSGGGNLNTAGATVAEPNDVAIDPAGGKIYWTDLGADVISWANLDGSGGGDLNLSGATVSKPFGIAIDLPRKRLFWTNFKGKAISTANLDGSGAHDLAIRGAKVHSPVGIQVDSTAKKIYWATYGVGIITYAKLSGAGAGDLQLAGPVAQHQSAQSLAIDHAAHRIYWTSKFNNDVSFTSTQPPRHRHHHHRSRFASVG